MATGGEGESHMCICDDRLWVQVQKRTFTNWVNHHLKGQARDVDELEMDLEDGVVLIKLLESLAPGKRMPGRYYANPKIAIHKTQNLAIAFRFITQVEHIALVNIGPGDIMDHNLKLVLGLIWTLILNYKIHSSPRTSPVVEKRELGQQKQAPSKVPRFGSPRKLLLVWVNSVLVNMKITNFTTDWNDGVTLSALVNYCKPGLIADPSSLNKKKGLENIKRAMQLAVQHLNIPQLLDPADLALEKPDELSVMTYISNFCSEGSPGHRSLLVWVQKQIPSSNISNFTADWLDGRALGLLVNAITSGGFSEGKKMTASNPTENAKRSMSAAEYQLGVGKTLTPEEFVDPDLSRLSRVAYLVQLQQAKAAKDRGTKLAMQVQPIAVEKIKVERVHANDQLDDMVWVDLDCADAGYAELTAEATGEKVGKVNVEVENRGPDLYRVKFRAPSLDLYSLVIRYGGEHVPGSPFAINLYPADSQKVQHIDTKVPAASGDSVALSFGTSHAGNGHLTGKANGSSAGEVPVRIDQKADGSFIISFKPPYPDLYKVDVNWGAFTASATGTTTGPVPIEIFREPNDCHLCFKPPQPDLYKVNVSWGGKPVPGSPFTIDLQSPTEPDKVESGDPIFTCIGEVAELPIDITYAGEGTLVAKCRGDRTGEIATEVSCIMKKFYHVSFLPSEEDRYTLTVYYGDKEVKRSPFIFDFRKSVDEEAEAQVLDMPILEQIPDFEQLPELDLEFEAPPPGASPSKKPQRGTEVRNFIGRKTLIRVSPQGRDKKKAKLTAMATGAKTGPTDVNIVKRSDGIFEASINPSEPDRYTLRVFLNQHTVPQSPFIITYIPSKSNASHCHVDGGDAFTHEVIDIHKPVSFAIDCSQGGEGPLKVTAEGPSGCKTPEISVTEREGQHHVYEVKFTAFDTGAYTLNVLWGENHVPNSPFKVVISDPKSTQVCPYGKPFGMDFSVDCKPSDIKAEAVHHKSGTVFKVKVKQVTKGKYKLTFVPKGVGFYLIHIYIRDSEIPNSPIIVRYDAPPNAEAITVQQLPETVCVGDMFSFLVDGKDGGSGELGIKTTAPKGKKGEKIEVATKANRDGTFHIECTPVVVGEHSFAILWSGKPIPHSPFHFTVVEKEPQEPDPSKCIVEEHIHIPKTVVTTKVISFRVSTAGAGPGEFQVLVEGPTDNPGKLEVTPVQGVDHTYHVSYKPEQPGTHLLHLNWGGKPLPNSPLKFVVEEPPQVEHGQSAGLDISSEMKLGDLECYAVHDDSGTRYQAEITRGQKGKYRITFDPKEPGMYDVHVLAKNKDIRGSPFRIKCSMPALPEKVQVVEKVQESCELNTPLNFTFDTHDAGHGEFECQLEAPKAPKEPTLKVEKRKDGIYKVQYIPNAPGKHHLHFLWGKKKIPGSPITITVPDPDEDQKEEAEEVVLTAPSDEERERGKRTSWGFHLPSLNWKWWGKETRKEYSINLGRPFKLLVKNARDDDMITAMAEGSKTGPSDHVHVSRRWDGTTIVRFAPSQPDTYTLQVKMNDEHVPNSPFTINYFIASNKCTITDISRVPETVEVDHMVEFKVDCTTAGVGSLTVAPEYPEGTPPEFVAQQVSRKPGLIRVQYTPRNSGTHIIRLLWEGHEIPQSPLTLKVIEPTMSITQFIGGLFQMGLDVHHEDEEEQEVEVIQPPLESIPQGGVVEIGTTVKEGDNAVFTATCHGEDHGEQVDVTMIKTSATTYKASFTPKTPDLYKLSIFRDDFEVKGSPYLVDLRHQKPVEPEECVVAQSPPLESTPFQFPDIPGLDSDSDSGDQDTVDLHLPPKEDKPDKKAEEFTCDIGTAIAVKVTAHSDAQRNGELCATATGDKTGAAEIDVRHKSDDIFLINFNPHKPDRYTIEATLNGELLPRMPFVVVYKMPKVDATKCKIVGSKELEGGHDIGQKISFDVDVKSAGDGKFEARAEGPSAEGNPSKLEVHPHPEKPLTYSVSYTPTAPGTHYIHMSWSGKPLPSSPIKLTVIDETVVPEHQHGAPVDIDLTSEGDVDFTAYALHEKDREHQIPVNISREGSKYKLKFQPTNPGLYYVHIFAHDKEIPSSPVVVKYGSAPRPDACRLVGITNSAYIGEPVSFDIDVSEAGGGKLKIRLEVPGTEQGKITVDDNKDGTVTVRYIPVSAGKHKFHCLWADQDIPGSPFVVQIRDREDEKLLTDVFLMDRTSAPHQIDLPDGSQGTRIDTTTDMSVVLKVRTQTEQQRSAPITSTVVGEKVGTIYPQISKSSEETYDILFTPPEPDCYTIDAKLGSEPVPMTPLVVNYSQPLPDEKKAKVVGLDRVPSLIQPQKKISFKVDMRLSGDGHLDVKAEVPEGCEAGDVETTEEEPYIYVVKYLPSAPGKHLLHINWDDKPIPGSPMNFDVQPVITFPHGKKAGLEIDLDVKVKQWDVEAYAIHTTTGSQHKVKITRVKGGKFRLTFQPKESGHYALHVLSQKQEIPGSPFIVHYDVPTNPEAVTVSGLKKKVWVNEPTFFNIDASNAGSGLLRISIKAPKESKKPHISVKEVGIKNYIVEYIPEATGVHYITVTWDDKPIPGSPFNMYGMRPSIKQRPQEVDVVTQDIAPPLESLPPGAPEQQKPNKPEPKEYRVPIGRAIRVKVKPSTHIQKGKIVAHARGVTTEDTDIPLTEDGDNFIALFNPTEPDRYFIEVKLDGEDVPGTPFIANYFLPPADPTKCVVGEFASAVHLHQRVRFPVDCMDSGDGELDVEVEGPSVDEADVQEDEPGKYIICYTPTAPGVHLLHIKWAGQPIPSSPVRIEVSDARKVKICESPQSVLTTGQPIGITFDTSTAGCGVLTATCTGDSMGELPVIVTHTDEHSWYRIEFTPIEQDIYQLSVYWSGKHVWGSPFKVDLKERKVDVTKIKISEPQLPTHPDGDVSITFKTDGAGKGEFSVVCVNSRGKAVPVNIKETSANTYLISFRPPKPDIYTMNVKYGGKNVEGSPFCINTLPSDPTRIGVTEPSTCELGKPTVYEFSTLYCGPGSLTATCHGQFCGQVPVDVEHEDGSSHYRVSFTPREPDLYTLHIRWSGTDIPNSPFIFNLLPCRPEKITPQQVVRTQTGEDIEYTCDIREGGQGTLTATCTGEVCGDVKTRVVQTEGTKYKINFSPPADDLYHLSVFYNDQHVSGSPYTIDLRKEIATPIEPQEHFDLSNLIDQFVPDEHEHKPEPPRPESPVRQVEQPDLERIPEPPIDQVWQDAQEHILPIPVHPEPKWPEHKHPEPEPKRPEHKHPEPEPKRPEHIPEPEPKRPEPKQPQEHITEQLQREPPKEPSPAPTPEEFTNMIGRALVVKVKAQTKEQKHGEVKATAFGEKTGEAVIEVRKKTDELFEVSFNPTEPDRYTVDIRLNDEPIPRSPFIVKYILPPVDATKCKFNQKDIPAHVEVGQEVSIKMSCKGAGEGNLEVKVEGPSAKGKDLKLDVIQSKDDPQHYDVRYTPTAAGYHFLHFHWSGTEIYGSPVKILVIDMGSATSFHYGKPVGFDIEYEGRQSDLRAYAIRDGSSTQISGKISKGAGKGKYKFTFNLKEPGLYYIHILAKDKELPMSPIVVRVLKPSRPDLLKVIDFPRKCYVQEWTKFTVDCKEAGGGDLHTKAIGPGGKEKGTLKQNDNKDGTYSIEYCPSVSGSHNFHMTWAGKSIPTMVLAVLEPGAENLESEFYLVDYLGHRHHTSPSDGKLDATTDMKLLIQVKAKTTEQKKAELTVIVTGEKTGSCEAQVSKSSEDTFEILFSPAEPDCYTIDAKLGSETVPQTPLTVYYTIPPTDATKCVIGGLDLIPPSPQVNKEIVIKVDVRTAGNGTLSVITEGPSGVIEDSSTTRVKEVEPSIYYIYFTPQEPGSYKLKILWSGVPVGGSPFCFEVQDLVIHPHGKPIDMEIAIDAAKTGDIDAHAIHQESGTRHKVKVSKIVKGKYKLVLSPKEPGVYAIHAFLKKKEIHGSPFYVRYDKPATPEACIVEGIPSQGYVFEPIKFTVNAREAGSGHLRVSVLGTANGTVTVDREIGRVFEVTYTASCPGDDKIDITWEKKHVPHSPCDIHIERRVPTCKTTLQGALSLVEVGQKISLEVCNIGKGEGEPTAHVSGLECGKVNTHIDKIDESCYKVEFTPEHADDYTLDLKLNDQHLRCSPLFVKAVEKGTFSTSFVHPDGVCHSDVEVQQQVNFVTHLEGAQSSSDVSAYCEYPGGSCELDVSEGIDEYFGLSFIPPTPGTYKIHTKVKDSEHPSSPYQVTCIEKEPECTIDESSLDVFSVPADIHHSPCFDIRVKESAQGKGLLTVDAKGPGEAKTVISQKEAGTYTCTISTPTPGRYLIFIYWNGALLKGCPFGMTFQQPSSIIGLDLENKAMKVGIPYHFMVNCEGMGEGALELTISPAGAADIRVSQHEDRKIYSCVIIPRQSGMGFEITARYNGQIIAGSPYRVNFLPAAGPRMVLSVQSERAETRDFSAQVESLDDHKQIAATLTQLLQGQYSLEFDPSQGQEYMVTLKYIVKYVPEERSESDQIELEGSPYTLVYANGSSCKIEGEGLGYAEVGQWNTFVISTESAGPGQLQVEIEGEGVTQGKEVQVETQKIGQYQYEVKYRVIKAGSYKLYILWGGRPLSGCPIAINCGGSSQSSSSAASSIRFAISDLHQEIQIGSAIEFSMQAEGLPEDGGEISVSAKSSTGKEIPGRVSEKGAGNYSCSIDPPSEAGNYSIIIKWNGAPISSPITVRVIGQSACKPQNVQITGTGLQDAFIGQECSFSIDTGHAGEGTLNVRVEGPKGGFHINLDRDPDNQRVIVAKYSPVHPGLYNVSIQWSGEHIPGSPFPVNIHGFEQQTA